MSTEVIKELMEEGSAESLHAIRAMQVNHRWTSEAIKAISLAQAKLTWEEDQALQESSQLTQEETGKKALKHNMERVARLEHRAKIWSQPSEFVVIDCGGGGNCGPLAMIEGARRSRTPDEVPKRRDESGRKARRLRSLVEKARTEREKTKETKVERSQDPNRWWTTEDIALAAEIMSLNVAIFEARPSSRKTSVSFTQGGSVDEPIVTIFGGNDFMGGHWVLLTEKSSVDGKDVQGTKVLGNMAEIWRNLKYDWRKTPEEVESRRRTEETIDVDRQEMESPVNGKKPQNDQL